MGKAVLGVCVLAVAMLGLTDAASAHFGGGGSFSCRASGVRVQSPIINLEPVVANGAQSPCQDANKQLLSVPVPPLLAAGVVTARTTSNPGGVPGGKAEASAATVNITLGSTVIAAQALASSAQSGCAIETGAPGFTGASNVVGLQVNGKPAITTSQSMTIPAAPLVIVYVNRQIIANNTITQRALEVYSPALGIDIVVGESIADVESCGSSLL
jgi:hypothetical protein